RRGAQGLVVLHHARHRVHRAVHLVDALHGGELRELAEELRVVERLERILVLQLFGHQAQEVRLSERTLLAAGIHAEAVAGVVGTAGGAGDGGHGYLPRPRVATASSLAVLSISTSA